MVVGMRFILYGVIVALASTGLFLIVSGLRARWRDQAKANLHISVGASRSAPQQHYVAYTTLLDSVEQQFACMLREMLPLEFTYTLRVAMNRIVVVRNIRKRQVWRDPRWNRIAQKSLDVVIMERATTKPVLVIMFEDNTKTNSFVSRDDMLAMVMREVEIPVVYIAKSTMQQRDAVQQQIIPLLRG